MDRLRRPQRVRTDPVPAEHSTVKSKSTRLSRSFRQTQQNQAAAAELDSPRNLDFKTPTRQARIRPAPSFSSESPHNDSDQQQDIIWDASPYRPGKRGSKAPSLVDISEIVRRIAPQHGRPKASEPVLQQWIGDSATIPCTPDLQTPKPKKKSPRSGGVDDLLKLAKQFDMNMFRQDEVEDLDQSQELLFDDNPEVPPENIEPRPSTQTWTTSTFVDAPVEDDLDLLFDAPTQHTSSDFSQVSDLLTKPATFNGNLRTGQVTSDAPVTTNNDVRRDSTDSATKASEISVVKDAAADDFTDDWEDDDLLNDSLVLEMTQDPFRFTAPKLCSTQKPFSQIQRGSRLPGPVTVPPPVDQSNAPKLEAPRQRSTFKLGSNHSFSVGASFGTDLRSKTVDQSSRGPAAADGSGVPSTAVISDDFLDDDLEAVFSSEPVWDDPADDDLLCEMCDDLENQMQNSSTTQTRPTIQRPALQPTTRTNDNRSSSNQPSAPGGNGALQAGSGTFRFSGSSWTPAPSSQPQKQFTFKKPNKPVPTTKVTCSAAEIELKKRHALERRRHRERCLQLAPPT